MKHQAVKMCGGVDPCILNFDTRSVSISRSFRTSILKPAA